MKSTLESVPRLFEALKGCRNLLLQAIHRSLEDPRLEKLQLNIDNIIREDAVYVKNSFKMRKQVNSFLYSLWHVIDNSQI